MSSDSKVYVGDIGTEILLDCGSDISSATVRRIKYKKPTGETGFWAASIAETTKLKYITDEGDLDCGGRWQLQAYVEMTGWKGHGEIVTVVVTRPLIISTSSENA